MAVAIGTDVDLGRVLELIAKRGRALVESTGVPHLAARGDELLLRASAGAIEPGRWTCACPPTAACPAKSCPSACRCGSGRRACSRASIEGLGVAGAQVGAAGADGLPRNAVGVVIAFDCVLDGRGFSEEDEHLLMTFAATRRTPSRSRRASRATAFAERSRPPRPSAAAGRANCTTRRSRALRACACS